MNTCYVTVTMNHGSPSIITNCIEVRERLFAASKKIFSVNTVPGKLYTNTSFNVDEQN